MDNRERRFPIALKHHLAAEQEMFKGGFLERPIPIKRRATPAKLSPDVLVSEIPIRVIGKRASQ